jgi:chemotaxis protein CheX
MSVGAAEITDITQAVWTSVLGGGAEVCDRDASDELPGKVMTSCVQITGAWEGAVTLQCAPDLARSVAATMLDVAATAATIAEVRDVMGELANMVGGNIKALLPGPTQLSLPIVVEGEQSAMSIMDSTSVSTVWFSSGGRPFVVKVLRRVGS